MFKKNKQHLQPALISAASELPEKQLKLLKGSWANSFYHEFFSRIDEEIFAVLYSSEPFQRAIAPKCTGERDGWSGSAESRFRLE